MFSTKSTKNRRRSTTSNKIRRSLTHEPLEDRLALSAVDFQSSCRGIDTVIVGSQVISGPEVKTGGMAYFEGSFDKSDNDGMNVTSRGHRDAPCGRRLTTDSGLPTPKYRIKFKNLSDNAIAFTARIKKVPKTLEVMNLAFDFSKAAVDRFRFDGSRLNNADPCVGLTGNISTATYDSIKQPCTIASSNRVRLQTPAAEKLVLQLQQMHRNGSKLMELSAAPELQ